MMALKKIALWVAVVVFALVSFALLLSALASDNRIQVTLIPDEPGLLVVGMGSDYEPSSHQIVQTVFRIPLDARDRQPLWNPATDELPLALSELEKMAFTNALGSETGTWATWKVTNVVFNHLGFNGADAAKANENRWSCALTLTNQDPAHYNFKTVCMLLDGTYVPGTPR